MVMVKAWDRRRERRGDYMERAALLVALVFIFLGYRALSDRSGELTNLARENRHRIADIADNTRRIDAERRRNVVAGCRLARKQNRAIVTFLRDLDARPETIARARVLFPTDTDCVADAVRRVAPPSP
jgi:hypothetical protein